MRKQPFAIIAAIAVSIAFVVLSGNCSLTAADKADDSTKVEDRYYGDTVFQYDGKTVIYEREVFEDENIESIYRSAFITYRDTVPADTCIVYGGGEYSTDGETLKYAVGVDTVYYNFKRLPEAICPEKELLPPGVKDYSYACSFPQSDTLRKCGFDVSVYLPENHEAWVRQFLAAILWTDVRSIFIDDEGADRILKEYNSIRSKPRKMHGIDASKITPAQIVSHFFKEHERLFREGNSLQSTPYDYCLQMVPAWQSKDGKYITYRFYSYYYTKGAAHGGMDEFYLTFNVETGVLLGLNDLFGKEDFAKAIGALEAEMSDYWMKTRGHNRSVSPGLSKDGLSSNYSVVIKESRDTVYYPRPALTRQGVVFSYQPYEVASFADGIIHFVVPYGKLNLKIDR